MDHDTVAPSSAGTGPHIRPLAAVDLPMALDANQANIPAVSDLDPARLSRLVDMSSLSLVAEVDGAFAGFCIVLAPGVDYDSVNYRWFGDRYDDFVYLDRVVVVEGGRDRGVGGALYAEVERATTAHWFTLEVNLRPRNDGSLRFHHRLGFAEVGQQETPYGALVSMLAKEVAANR